MYETECEMRKACFFITMICFLVSCANNPLPNQEMVNLLKEAARNDFNADNIYSPQAIIKKADSILDKAGSQYEINKAKYTKANALLQIGEEQKAIILFEELLTHTPRSEVEERLQLKKDLAISWMRSGE